ncbi:YajG family lipoprotein [Marinobacter bohaiensis]|uniref:DUF4136 domain-containing protein n=1 Tax=Marinobacter bohaiensis TaxID=2201898 RepID=UPI000DAD1F6C|nr:DUF4136 domain-containing protein [Marinobacter bohaiensis]
MVAIPAFPFPTRARVLAFLALGAGLLTGCSLQPQPPLSLDQGAKSVTDAATSFSTGIRPAPGRSRFLRRVEQEVIRQMQALGYTEAGESADLRVSVRLDRTDTFRTDLMDTVDSGRLTLVLYQDDRILRTGRSPILNSNDLDFMRDDEVVERVRLFLDGIQSVAPPSAKSN